MEVGTSPEQWLQMLKLRTVDEAAEVVKSVKEMSIEKPQEALDFIWNHFADQDKSIPQAARKLSSRLQSFSDASTKKVRELWKFALACQQATLMSTQQGRQLSGLYHPDMQRTVVSCLDRALRGKWGTHVLKAEDDDSEVPFSKFSEWISNLAKRYSGPNLIYDDKSSQPHPGRDPYRYGGDPSGNQSASSPRYPLEHLLGTRVLTPSVFPPR